MSTAEGVLLASAVFSLVTGALYWFLSRENAGAFMLLTMTVGLLVAAGYLTILRRRVTVAADQRDVRPSDVGGERVGVFASRSAWPVILALGFAVGLTGLIYGWWLALVGAVGVTAALLGLVRDDAVSAGRVRRSARSRQTPPP